MIKEYKITCACGKCHEQSKEIEKLIKEYGAARALYSFTSPKYDLSDEIKKTHKNLLNFISQNFTPNSEIKKLLEDKKDYNLIELYNKLNQLIGKE